jgi:hypothetical protein
MPFITPPETDISTVQLELRLWPDRDPNLHRIGIYPFEVTNEALLAALDHIGASSDSITEVEVQLSDSTMWCAIKLKNGDFGAMAPIALPGRTQTGAAPVRFSVKARPLYKVAKYMSGASFVFDRNTAKLYVKNRSTILAPFHVIPLPAEEADDEGRSLGQIHFPSGLRDGVRSVSVLSQRKSPPGFPHQGLRIADGRITSGYLKAVSSYACPGLPAGLDVTLPRQHIVAARSLFGKFRGQINVVETASRIRLRSPDLEVYWTKGGSWPKFSEYRENATLATAEVDLMQLSGFLPISSFPFFVENLRFEIDEGAKGRMLKISGESSKIWAQTRYPIDASSNDAGGRLATWKVMISAKDAYDATVAVTTERVLIRVFDRGIAIESVSSENECKTLLAGVELR